jgi:glutaredoxin-related protein
MRIRKTLITYDHVVEFLKNRLAQPPCGNDHDFLPMLKEGSVTLKVSMDVLLKKGFRKAYRQIVEGL